MKRISWVCGVFALATMAVAVQSARADLILSRVRGPEQCPPGLTVKSKSVKPGQVAFEVLVDAETIAQAGKLYAGRVSSNAFLQMGSEAAPTAFVQVQGSREGRTTHYQLRLSPSAARSAQLQIGVSLHEADGFPTIGGGHTIQLFLAGFLPAGASAEAPTE